MIVGGNKGDQNLGKKIPGTMARRVEQGGFTSGKTLGLWEESPYRRLSADEQGYITV
tara:strand:- start:566 stop:736 length:171 start_codon:yes stop_codon:yes gene_type:complete